MVLSEEEKKIRIRANSKRYYERNKEKIKIRTADYVKHYRETHKEKMRAYAKKSYYKKRGKAVPQVLSETKPNECSICGKCIRKLEISKEKKTKEKKKPNQEKPKTIIRSNVFVTFD